EGVRAGARAVRRCRRGPRAARPGRAPGLGAPAAAVRRALARAAQPPDAVWLHLPLRARPDPPQRAGGLATAVAGRPGYAGSPGARLPGHARVAGTVPGRRGALGLRGRAPAAPRQHDAPG